MPSARNSKVMPRVIIAVVATVVLAGIAAAGWSLARGLFDRQFNVTLADVMSSEPDAVESTDSLCGPTRDCVEAYETNEATYYRFSSRDQATAFALTVADGFQSNYIVMDFAGKNSSSQLQQLWAMQHLAGFWNDYEGGFPDR